MTRLTVVISYYKALDNLQLILKALDRQSCMDFEVLLSEDDNNEDTVEYLESVEKSFKFHIKHIYQAVDDGFRKNAMLNRAIVNANSDKIAFIDGDCIPHTHFVKQYIKNIDTASFCVGRSVLLDKKKTETLKKKQILKGMSLLSLLLFSKSRKLKDGIYFSLFPLSTGTRLLGRNWGCHRENLLQVNGFDEAYVYAGTGEDVDIEWRLLGHGLKKKSVRNKAIVYHLYHKKWYSMESEKINHELLKEKKRLNQVRCLNGIKTLE